MMRKCIRDKISEGLSFFDISTGIFKRSSEKKHRLALVLLNPDFPLVDNVDLEQVLITGTLPANKMNLGRSSVHKKSA